MPELNGSRHALVTAAHDFLLSVMPFRNPESHQALSGFIVQAADLNCRPSDLRLVLLDVLSVLGTSGSCARLLDQHLAARRLGTDPLQEFALDVSQLIRTRVVDDRNIERGMAIVESRYSDAALSQAGVAAELGLTASYFATRFRERAGLKFSEYLRQTRLDAAARLLTTSDRRVKDIWVSVGYNDASNFDHQFKARFAMSPGEYRYRRSAAEDSRVSTALTLAPDTAPQSLDSMDVLIVDDHQNTREAVGRYLNSVGYAVATAASGSEGLETVVRRRPHSVVLDYHLPDMDGIAWLQALREREAPPPVRVVLFTADLDVVSRRQELDALHARYLSKLCDIDDLVALLQSALP